MRKNKNMVLTPHQIEMNNAILNEVKARFFLKNDAAIARFLLTAPPTISKMRAGKLPIGSLMLIRAHEQAGMSFKEIRQFVPDDVKSG